MLITRLRAPASTEAPAASVRAAIAVAIGVATAVPVAVKADPTPVFVDRTTPLGITYVHHENDPMPGYLPGETSRFGTGAAASDIDRDGDLDLCIADVNGHPSSLYRNDGGVFVDVAASAGLVDLALARTPLFADLDGDGYDDLVLWCDSDGSVDFPYTQLYRNLGDGTFQNVSAGCGLEPLSVVVGGGTAGDYDHDGDLDLYTTSWLSYGNHLYRNEGGFTFVDVTVEAGLELGNTVSQWTPLFVDLDGDRWQDLFCAVDFAPDYAFRNEGDGTFTPFAPGPDGFSINNDMGVASGDVDRDGDIDLLTTNITDDAAAAEGCCNWYYQNDGAGTFTNEAATRGVNDARWGWGAAFVDVELDGDLDLAVVNGWMQTEWVTPSYLFQNDGTGHFTDVAVASGFDHDANTRGLLPFDCDGDGDVDFLLTDLWDTARLFRNETPREDRHFLNVRLEGTESNRNGVGARVYAEIGPTTQMVEIVCGGSFYAGPPMVAQFGLGTATLVDRLRIEWPSGIDQELLDVAADQFLVVVEEATVGVPGGGVAVSADAPAQAMPNPFRTGTRVTLSGGEAVRTITVYDTAGRLRRAIELGGSEPGATWDGLDAAGRPVSPGVYVLRVTGAETRAWLRVLRLP